MTILHLGVLDVSYAWGGKTTGDVATILEAKYHLMQTFADMSERQIAAAVTSSLHGAMETIAMGGPSGKRGQAFAAAGASIETMFRDAIDSQAFDNRIPGVPTMAALNGVRHSRKRAYVKREPRASFFDTGLLASSFRAWVDD